jgi:hypothetical protein
MMNGRAWLLAAVAAACAIAAPAVNARVVLELTTTNIPYFCGDNTGLNALGDQQLFDLCYSDPDVGGVNPAVEALEYAATLFTYWIGVEGLSLNPARRFKFVTDGEASLVLSDDITQFPADFMTPPPPGPSGDSQWEGTFTWNGSAWEQRTFFRVYDATRASTFMRLIEVEVAEPATIAIIGTGLLGLGWLRRRSRSYDGNGYVSLNMPIKNIALWKYALPALFMLAIGTSSARAAPCQETVGPFLWFSEIYALTSDCELPAGEVGYVFGNSAYPGGDGDWMDPNGLFPGIYKATQVYRWNYTGGLKFLFATVGDNIELFPGPNMNFTFADFFELRLVNIFPGVSYWEGAYPSSCTSTDIARLEDINSVYCDSQSWDQPVLLFEGPGVLGRQVISFVEVSEPATAAVIVSGLAVLAALRSRRRAPLHRR